MVIKMKMNELLALDTTKTLGEISNTLKNIEKLLHKIHERQLIDASVFATGDQVLKF